MAILDNTTRAAQPTDVGFKISKPGYDARSTAGSNMIFDSSWPSLQTVFETTIPNTITNFSATATLGHGLTYPPFCMVWAVGPDDSGLTGNPSVQRVLGLAEVDKNNIYLNTFNYLGSFDFLFNAPYLHIKCFNIDLTKDIDYDLAPGDTFKYPYDNNYGIKIVKPTKDINSTDLRDFLVHSRAQSPLVMAVKTEQTVNPANPDTVQYTSKFKYPSWAYGFIVDDTHTYRFAPLSGQAYPVTFSDGFTTQLEFLTDAGDIGATLVILRDPFFAAKQDTATY